MRIPSLPPPLSVSLGSIYKLDLTSAKERFFFFSNHTGNIRISVLTTFLFYPSAPCSKYGGGAYLLFLSFVLFKYLFWRAHSVVLVLRVFFLQS